MATFSSSDDDEISESDLEDYESKAYNLLKTGGKNKIIKPDGRFRCPFCTNKKKQGYIYKDLLQHATGIGASNARSFSHKAMHLALARFLLSDIPSSSSIAAAAPPPPSGNCSTSPQPRPQGEDHFVWPWMGVLTHVPISEASAPDLEDKLSRFNPAEILGLWDENDQGSGTAIVKFNKDWSGFKDAMAFENHFKANHLGKEDWRERGDAEGSSPYGWMAGEDDYNSEGPVADVLRTNGRLRTVFDLTEEEERERKRKVAMLADQIEVKNERLLDMESRYNATAISIQRVMEDTDKIQLKHMEETRRLQREAYENSLRVFRENEKLKMELCSKRKEVELRTEQLNMLEAQSDGEKRKLDDEKQKTALENSSLELATMVQKKADEDVLRLSEDHKREKEAAFAKILQLEKQLDQKQQLQLEIEQLRGKLRVMEYLGEDGDTDMHKKMEELQEKLEEDTEHLESINSALLTKDKRSIDELQEARKLLITGLDNLFSARTLIGIKRVGELDEKPFRVACKEKFKASDAEMKAAEYVSSWQEEIRNSAWHPYKIISDSNGAKREVIDEDDEKLRSLWIALGDDVFNAVKTALMELNEYNPSGRYPMSLLWNFKEKRQATMKEVIQYMLKQLKSLKRKR